MPRFNAPAFSLVELLVVVTIMVLLLALLTPALDQAVYQAEMAVCAARLKGLGAVAQVYAMDHGRMYPDRSAMHGSFWKWPGQIADTEEGYDLRPMLQSYMGVDMFRCPMTGKVSFAPADTSDRSHPLPWVGFSPYAMWFGFKFDAAPAGMRKLGDRLVWSNDGGRNFEEFQVLAADWEMLLSGSSWGAHPDRDGLMVPFASQLGIHTQAERHTVTRWQNTTMLRKLVDRNFATADGAVRTVYGIVPQDPRLTPVGLAMHSTNATLPTGREQLPAIGQ
jgi:hypothetical protein